MSTLEKKEYLTRPIKVEQKTIIMEVKTQDTIKRKIDFNQKHFHEENVSKYQII